MKVYIDEWFCEHCQEDTLHKFVDMEHERDGSYDTKTCEICNWWVSGLTDEYNPPRED